MGPRRRRPPCAAPAEQALAAIPTPARSRRCAGCQAVHRARAVRPRRRPPPAHPPALDELPASQTLAHLRSVLVAVGALPARDEEMVRLEALPGRTARLPADPEQRQILHRYLIWHLVRRLRSRNNGQATRAAVPHRPPARPRRRRVPGLARRPRPHPGQLPAGRPRPVARRCSEPPPRRSRAFIRWARASKLTTGHFPAARWNGPARAASMTSTAGTPPAGSCTTTPSSPRTASPACSSCSTPRARPRSAR